MGLPCCWIRRMAPGILPPAISFRMYSPMRASFSVEKLDRATGSPARPAAGQPARAAASGSASAVATRPRRKPSVLHGFIDQLLERALDALTFRGRLLQQHEQHV